MSSEPSPWTVILHRNAERSLRRLHGPIVQRIDRVIRELANNPRPHEAVKMVGYDIRWRIRVGDWRIIYEVYDDQLLVLIIRIRPRGAAYE